MRILGIAHAVPETLLTNDEVIDRVSLRSRETLDRDGLIHVANHLGDLFEASGIQTRRMTDGREQPIELVVDATERALATAGVTAPELDFIIFGGVSRGFIVPSCASAVQHAIGASGVTCFDVLDACASWARAVQVAGSFLKSGIGKVGLIVNSECGFYENYDPWTIRSANDIELEGSSFTIGEAATAVIVGGAEPGVEPEIWSGSFGEFGDLAVLPIVESHGYMRHKRQPTGNLRFHTRSGELTLAGLRLGVDLMREVDPLKGRSIDAFVPHAGAAPSVDVFMKAVDINPAKLVMTYRGYGNTVSASIPLGLSLATSDGRISRGDLVFAATIAAGISIVTILFTY